MSILNKLKNWFKKEEPKEEYYIDFRKLRQRELEQDFNIFNSHVDFNVLFTSKRIPLSWLEHIEKCVQYEEIEIAISHLLYWSKICHFAYVTYGIDLDIKPIWDKIKTSKPYKQRLLKEKLERMEKDFE